MAAPVQVDVAVLGVGTCGEDLSLRLLDAGLVVVGIEAALVGGECAYWACLPTKMMIRAANLLGETRRVDRLAGHAEVAPAWTQVAARVRTEATGGWDDSVATERFEDHGGTLVHGRGALTGPRTVKVGGQSFTARRGIVIATGSRPVVPPIPGLAAVDYWTTHDVIQAETLPQSLTILGGGQWVVSWVRSSLASGSRSPSSKVGSGCCRWRSRRHRRWFRGRCKPTASPSTPAGA